MKFMLKVLKIMMSNVSNRLSACVLSFWFLISMLPIFIPSLQDVDINLPNTRVPPHFDGGNPLSWMGYDSVGSSVLLQVLNGARVSLVVGLFTVALCLILGVPMGAFAALNRGWGDKIVSRLMDILLSFPPLVLPIAVTAFLGGGLMNTVIALSMVGWVGSAKLVRGELRALDQREFVEAARALGAGRLRIAVRHLLPLAAVPVMVHSIFALAGVVLAEAGLSFLGLGMGAGYTSWGTLLSEGRSYLLESPHLVIFPSLALLSVVLSLNSLAETLRIALNPKAKQW